MAVAALVVLFALNQDEFFRKALELKSLDVGRAVPTFEFPGLDGRIVDMSDYRDKFVLVNIWATWCRACVDEMPSIQKLYEKFQNDDFEIVETVIMKNSVKIILTIPALLMLFSSIALNAGKRAYGQADYMEELSIVRFDDKVKAQNFILINLSGNEVSLEDYRGQIVLINFWATWCLPCRIEMPSMERLYAKFKNDGFTILAIDLLEDADRVKAFKEEYKLNFPILLDSDGSVAKFYGVVSIPITYLIDRDGFLIGSAIGARDWSDEKAFKLIDQLLKNSPNF